METITPVKTDFIATELRKFETEHEITEGSLYSLAASYQNLTVNGVDDKEGLKAVESARKELKKKRVEIKKISEELRDSAVKFQKAVIAREKELIAYIEPQELRLMAIEDAIWEEKENIRKENERKESERIQNMLDKLNAVNQGIDFHTLKGMTDEQFNDVLEVATAKYEEGKRFLQEEQQRQAEIARIEELNRREEEARLAKERKEVEKMQAEMKDAQDKLALEQMKLQRALDEAAKEKKAIQDAKEAAEREKQRQAELEQARKEAAEKARIEAEAKAQRETEEKQERENQEKEWAQEKMLAGADKGKFEKLQYLLETNFLNEEVIIWLHFKSKKGKAASARVHELLKQARQICTENIKA